MKTIRQIADEIGVSKQAVYKRVRGSLHTDVAPYMDMVNGVTYILEQGEKLIIKAFLENNQDKDVHRSAYKEVHMERIQTVRKLVFYENKTSP